MEEKISGGKSRGRPVTGGWRQIGPAAGDRGPPADCTMTPECRRRRSLSTEKKLRLPDNTHRMPYYPAAVGIRPPPSCTHLARRISSLAACLCRPSLSPPCWRLPIAAASSPSLALPRSQAVRCKACSRSSLCTLQPCSLTRAAPARRGRAPVRSSSSAEEEEEEEQQPPSRSATPFGSAAAQAAWPRV